MTELLATEVDPDASELVVRHVEAHPSKPSDQPDRGPATMPRSGAAVDLGLIRPAQPQDFPGIMDLCRLMNEENLLHSFSEPKVAHAVSNAINRDGGIIGLIGDPEPVGIIILAIGSDWYSEDRYLGDMVFFVRQDHRRSNYAKTLLSWAKHVADRMGMMFCCELRSRNQTDAKIGLFDRHFDRLGSVFVHNLNYASMVSHEGAN